jgi:hypothetical protein
METVVATPPKAEPTHDGDAEATRPTSHLFQWSTFVNVGPGAEKCEHARDGACEDAEHFHCWLCLPNVFQNRDIRDKALAAKARKRRALMLDGSVAGTEPSDASLILEEQIDAWTLTDETYGVLIERIAQRNVERGYSDIVEELNKTERYEHRGQDLEEWRRQSALAEEQRTEEYARLEKDMEDYREEFEVLCLARHEREVTVLRHEPRDAVLEIERRFQIDGLSSESFTHIYYTWAYYTCARVPDADDPFPTKRVFATPEALKGSPPEVIEALADNFRSLETRTKGRGEAAGN